MHPDFDYALVQTPRGALVLAQDLVEACLKRYGLEGKVVATRPGRRARAHRVPPSVLRPRLAGVPRRLRDARAGHRHRALVARVRRRGLPLVPPLRHEGRRDPEAGAGRRPLRREPAALRRPDDLEGEPADRRQAARGRRAAARREVHAQLHALLAPQDADHLSRDDAVVRRHGRRAGLPRRTSPRRRCARPRCAASKPRRSIRRGARRACTA